MKTTAAILVEQRKPLVVDEVEVPALSYGQVLVQIHASRICGSQIGEIDGVKGPDRYLPHLLGHEAGQRWSKLGRRCGTLSRGIGSFAIGGQAGASKPGPQFMIGRGGKQMRGISPRFSNLA